jgi:DNA invertase Pin-like site-specific DNA recombinase
LIALFRRLKDFVRVAKQETARISERTIIGLKTARAKGKRLGRPPLPEATIHRVLALNRENALGARKIAKQTTIPLGTVNAILTRERKKSLLQLASGCVALLF